MRRGRKIAAALAGALCGMLLFAPIGAAQPTIDLLSEFHLRADGPVARSLGYPIAVENAGDVNGDGRPDVIVGFRGQDAYVVFGRSSPGTVDLAALGTGGFRIDGAVEVDGSVEDVAGAGDVNGDGLADLVVGSGGGAFVVFGKSSTSPVDLSALGAGGFAISPPPGHSTPLGTCPGPDIGSSVDGIGDFNGDGRPDVVVAGPGPLISFCGDTGAWVVYGKASTGAVALGDPQGQAEFLWPGENAAGAGDVNGDGRPDVIVGTDIGGNGATVRFAGGGGFSMTGAGTGFSTAGVGDVNGDGLADVAVGAPDASNNGRPYSGSAWIVFGQTSSTDLDLMQLGTHGFRIDGAHGGDPGYVGDQAGWALDGAGDVNGDGRADVLLGAPGASNNGRRFSGSAFVVFGTAVDGQRGPGGTGRGRDTHRRRRRRHATGPTRRSRYARRPGGVLGGGRGRHDGRWAAGRAGGRAWHRLQRPQQLGLGLSRFVRSSRYDTAGADRAAQGEGTGEEGDRSARVLLRLRARRHRSQAR